MIDLQATTTVYIDPIQLQSQLVQYVLHEKEVLVTYETALPAPLKCCELPTLNHNQFIITGVHTILEYINERFPEPNLLSDDLIAKAATRMVKNRIVNDWYTLYENHAYEPLINQINESDEALNNTPFFLHKNITLIDCALVPLLAALPTHLHCQLRPSVRAYLKRMISREPFKQLNVQLKRCVS